MKLMFSGGVIFHLAVVQGLDKMRFLKTSGWQGADEKD